MQYSQLFIDFLASHETYQKVTELLGVIPQPYDSRDEPDSWFYRIASNSEDRQEDFINLFLDILEPHFTQLAKLGIGTNNILFWYVYEYEHQCSMSFSPCELARIGNAGISLNIDCHDSLKKKS